MCIAPAAPVMGKRVFHLDVVAPPPPPADLAGSVPVRIYFWRDDIPVTMLDLPADRDGSGCGRWLDVERTRERLKKKRIGKVGAYASDGLPSVSVIVPTRGRPYLLPLTLAALARQTHPFEQIVVDNTAGDAATENVIRRRFANAVYVREPRAGVAHARNAGAAVAAGEVLAFTDDDCMPSPRWVERLARAFADDADAGCVTGPILPLELETPAQELMERRGGFNRGFSPRRHTSAEPPERLVQAWRYGAGASMAFRRDAFQAVGGFDPALNRSEDLDIFYRVLRSGRALTFQPGAAVRHRHLREEAALRRCLFHWGWGYLSFLDKVHRQDAAVFAAAARAEQREWLRYQLRHNILVSPAAPERWPLALALAELAGGLLGARAYPLARRGLLHP